MMRIASSPKTVLNARCTSAANSRSYFLANCLSSTPIVTSYSGVNAVLSNCNGTTTNGTHHRPLGPITSYLLVKHCCPFPEGCVDKGAIRGPCLFHTGSVCFSGSFLT